MTDGGIMVLGICFNVLGPLHASRRGVALDLGHPQQRAVLAALVMREGAQVSAEQLVADVWGEEAPRTAVAALRTYIYRLRRILGDGQSPLIRSFGEGYVLAVEPETVDLATFVRALAEARGLRDAGDPEKAELCYAEGLALWTGPALAGVPGPYAEAQRTRLGDLRLSATEERLACAVNLGRGAEAAAELSVLVADHPLRERLRELQMLALYASGRQAEALAVYADTRHLLAEQLGVEPGPALRETQLRILKADPALTALTAHGARAVSVAPAPNHTDDAAPADPAPAHPAPTRPAPSTPSPVSAPAPSAVPVPAQLPADLPRFIGRTAELARLTSLAGESQHPPEIPVTYVVHGMAGIGKTTLAVHTAHLLAPRFPDGQLYINLRGFDPDADVVDPADALAQFLEALGIRPGDVPSTVAARAALYRSVLARRSLLILLDNARDAVQVRPLLPGTPGCLTLVTSRGWLRGLSVSHQAGALALGRFDSADARALLVSSLGELRSAAQAGAVDDIIGSCDGLPLALAVVAARAGHAPGDALGAVAEELRDARGGLDAFALGGDPAADPRAVFSWSYRALGSQAARLFRLLALHPGPDFTAPAAAALAALPKHRAALVLDELADAHLLTEHTTGRFTRHDLLRAYAEELVYAQDGEDDRREALLRLLDHYTHTAHIASRQLSPGRRPIPLDAARPGVTTEDIEDLAEATAWFTAEYRVMLRMLKLTVADGLDVYARHLAWVLENFLDGNDLWHEALAAAQLALEAARHLGDPAIEARARRGLARALARFGRLDEARDHLDASLRLLGDDGDPVTRAETHRLLSWVMEQQGVHGEALVQSRRALRLHLAAGRPLDVAVSLNSVGWSHARLGHYHQTLVVCRAALRVLEGFDQPRTEANTRHSLGYAHDRLGRRDDAVKHYERALKLFRDLDSRHDQAFVLDCLGDLHHGTGRGEAARAAWSEALDLLEQLEDPDAARLRAKLAT